MRTFTALAALAAVALVATPAVAQDASWYAGAGYTHYDFDTAEVGGLTGRLGYRTHPNFAVEGEATIGTNGDNNVELDSAYGVYAVGIAPVSPNLDLFGRVGWQRANLDTPGPDLEADGVGYGAGVNWRMSNGFGIRGEYTRLDSDDGEADSFSIGAVVNY